MTNGEALVLVAIPDEAMAATLEGELRRLGCKVVTVTRVVDAIAELHGVDFDVAFVTLSFPRRSALDVLRAASELSPDTENVVILDAGQQDAPVECVRNGAFDFLHRPLAAGEIKGVLERAMSRRQLRTSTAMFRASSAILTNTTADELLKITVDLAADLLSADGVAFYRRRPDGELDLAVARGFSRATDAEDLFKLVYAVAKEPPSPTPRLLPEDGGILLETTRLRGAIICPLVIDGRLAGLLAIERSTDPRPYRRSDAERSGVLASQLRLALDNLRLVERTVATERLAAIGELAAGVAHEINNPLTYVLSNCELALETVDRMGPAGEDLQGMLTDVKEGAERIRDIARDLRMLSRNSVPPAPDLTPHPQGEIFDLSDAVRAALRVSRATIRDWIDIHLDLAPGLFVAGSRGRACQVFVNLLVNAAQAAGAVGERVRVEIKTSHRDGRMFATIQDFGPGIDPAHLPRIFEAFFTTKSGDKGTGLGLSISRAIVEDHGGTIDVISELGKGTTFVIEIPAALETGGERGAAEPVRLTHLTSRSARPPATLVGRPLPSGGI
ncbi:MAG TPA: ATP-binding protein [Labilithrix sp.]|nr:ATP-binding protein [Labilithrix sp.]